MLEGTSFDNKKLNISDNNNVEIICSSELDVITSHNSSDFLKTPQNIMGLFSTITATVSKMIFFSCAS